VVAIVISVNVDGEHMLVGQCLCGCIDESFCRVVVGFDSFNEVMNLGA
jgi:hypothetical protein